MSSPGSKGTLDDYFIDGGRHVWIELKHGDNTPTGLQWIEIEDIRAHGGEAYWANSLEQVVHILCTNVPEFQGNEEWEEFIGFLPPQEEWML